MSLVEIIILLFLSILQFIRILTWRTKGLLELKTLWFVVVVILALVVPGASTVLFIVGKVTAVLTASWLWIIAAIFLDLMKLTMWAELLG